MLVGKIMKLNTKKIAMYILGIFACAMAGILAIFAAARFWTRAEFPWPNEAYGAFVLFIAFFVGFVYVIINSEPNSKMTRWEEIRYRCTFFTATTGFIFLVLAISLFLYIFVFHKNSDAEAVIVVAVPLLIGFISLSITAVLAYTVREYFSKKAYRWLTVPAIAILVLWSSAFIIGAVMKTINLANQWKH